MPRGFAIQWEGDKLLGLTLDAVEKAVNETTAETAVVMQADAPRDTGTLADNIYNVEAEVHGQERGGRGWRG